ncbi:MAG: prenyltransferase, partial [Burkholderiales bacterium PBB5]
MLGRIVLRSLHALAGTLRLPFLLLTPACVALGAALAQPADGALSIRRLVLVLLGALAAHASVNVLNEWHDMRSGLDALTRRTPFSGGSGALLTQPQALPAALALGLALLALAGACGLALLWQLPSDARLALLLLGLAGLGLVLAYTPWLTRQPLLCLLAPGLGFGPLMVLGTQLALAGGSTPAALVASLVPWCQVSGLLLLNQFPDVEADRQVGRRHLPMLWGRPRAARLLAVLLLQGEGALAVGVLGGVLQVGAAMGLLT